MKVIFDPTLVALSILIAVCGAYTCFHLVTQLRKARGAAWKATLSAAAVVIGGGIWSMHFIGMLAMSIPVTITYNLLETLISALVSIGMTAIALFVVSFAPVNRPRLLAAGLLMGGGISAMHYLGMAAIRANCLVAYDPWLVSVSVGIGVGVSMLALWLAFRTQRHREKLAAALVMGLAIPAMHYTGIAATSFLPLEVGLDYSAAALGGQALAVIIAVTTFLLFGSTFLVAIPDPSSRAERPIEEEQQEAEIVQFGRVMEEEDRETPASSVPAGHAGTLRIPVVRNKITEFIEVDEILCIKAESHYSTICTDDGEFFCSLSLAELRERLDEEAFLRVHRSHIVNLQHVRTFKRLREQGQLTVGLGERSRTIPVSRGNVGSLKAALGI